MIQFVVWCTNRNNLNLFLILSYSPFVNFILSIWWVSNLIVQSYHKRFFYYSKKPSSTPTVSKNSITKSCFGSYLLLIFACLYPFVRFFLFNYFFWFSPIDFQFQPCFLFRFFPIQCNWFSILQASYFFVLRENHSA